MSVRRLILALASALVACSARPTATGTASDPTAAATASATAASVAHAVAGATPASPTNTGLVPPAGLTATTTLAGEIDLHWSLGAGDTATTQYLVQRALVSNGALTTLASLAATSTSYQHLHLAAGATYFYKVSALDVNGVRSAPSAEAAGSTTASNIGDLRPVAATSSSITLRWTSPGTPQFQVFRGPQAGPYVLVASISTSIAAGSSVTYTQNLIPSPGTRYYYVVAAKDSLGVVSPYSNEAQTMTLPIAPARLAAAASGTGVLINWTAPAAAQSAVTEVEVLRSATKLGTYTQIGTTAPTASSYQDEPGPGAMFFYKLTATDAAGTSVASNPVTALTIPAILTDASASASVNTATVSWTATAGAASYNLYRSLASGGPYTWVASTQTPPAFDTGVAGTTYFYVATSYNASGESANSNETQVTMAPPPASGLVATLTGNAIVLTWRPTTGALGYTVSRSDTTGGPYTQIGATTDQNATTFSDSGIAAGATYYYVVTATNAAGAHTPSNEATATVLPGAPTALVALASGYGASLTWTAPLGALSFSVYRSATSGGGYVLLGSPTDSSFVDATAPAGGTFYYVVTATNSSGTSGNSNESRTTIQPGAATGLTATSAGRNVTLAWQAPAGATSYTVYRSITSGSGYASLGSAATTSYSDTSAPAGCTCYYVVTANNTGGSSGNSNESSAITQPGAPTNLIATTVGGGYSIALSWKAPAGATSFTIYRSSTSGNGYASLGSQAGTAFTDTKAPPGAAYYYVVTATNGAGTSGNSNEATSSVLSAPPAGLTATAAGSGVALTWSAPAGTTSFTVYRSVNSGTGYVAIGTPGVASFTDNTAVPGATYYYVVTSTSSSGTSGYSSEASISLKPSAATGLTATAGFGTSVNLSWNATSGATNYSIFRGSTAGGEAPTAIASQAGTTFNDPSLPAGSTFFYVVTASNAGGTSASSNEAFVILKPGAISDLAASSGATVTLTWTASPGATGYVVYRGSTVGGELATALASPASNTFIDNTATAGATWFYVVAATNAGGTSASSNEASATRRPAAITDLAATMGGAGVHLAWTAVSGATGYSVFRGSTAGGEGAVAIGSPAGNSFDDSTGGPGTTWFYTVTANNSGGASVQSNEATISIKPAAVGDLAAALGAGSSINLTWTAVAGATSYKIFRGSATGAESATAMATTATNTFNDASAALGGTYFYVVTAINAGGTSANSNEATLVLKPTAITDLATAQGAGTSITLTWSAPPGATSYRIFRGSMAAGESLTAFGTSATASFNDATTASGSTWFYVVTALNKGGTSGNSNEAHLTIGPAQIQDLVATVSGTTITLSWSPIAGATSYNVFSGATAGGESNIAIGSTATATFRDASLNTGTAYYFKVSALNAGGTSGLSNEARGVTVLPPPSSLTATASVFDITLTWPAVTNAGAYDVLRSTLATSSFVAIATVTGTTYCNCETTSNPRLANTTYYYEVVARSVDATSTPSTTASATTVFNAPTGLAVANTGTTGADRTRLGLTWAVASGASGYNVQRALSAGGPFADIGQAAGTSYTDSGLALSTTYYYQVLARSAAGVSPPSLVASGTTLGSPWQSASGLNGGEVKAVMFDPTSSGKNAVAAVRGGAGVYRSTDSGQTWTATGGGLTTNSIASMAYSQGRFFAGSFGAGVFVSADGGQTWTPSNAGLSATASYTSIAAGPNGSATVYAATARSVYVTTLNGDFWKVSSFVPAAPILSMAVDTGNAATVYAATDGAGLYKSLDTGATWSVVGLAGQSLQGGILIDPIHPLNLWVGTAAGVQASTDGGATWTLQGSIAHVRSLTLTGTTLYAGTNDAGVYQSTAGGAWTATNGSAAFFGGVTTIAAVGAQVLAGSYAGHGLFHSTNSGATWSNATSGITAADTTALAISADASELFAVAGHQLLKSVNHGATWTSSVTAGLPYPVIASAVAVDPSSASVVYVGSGGVSRSTDGGATFVDTGANFVPAALAIPAQAHNIVYAAIFNGGVYKADFSVATPVWTPMNKGITDLRMHSVAVDPANAQNVFAGGEGGFFRSTDGGANWSASSSGLTFVRSINAASNGKLFAVVGAGTSSNLQQSADGGVTFTAVNFGTTAVQNLVSISVDPATGQTMYAVGNSSNGSKGGLFKSIDGGATWNALKTGVTSTRLHKVLMDPTASASLFLASEDNGVLLSASAGE
jgi:fibronectin type 3 domain-containing protein